MDPIVPKKLEEIEAIFDGLHIKTFLWYLMSQMSLKNPPRQIYFYRSDFAWGEKGDLSYSLFSCLQLLGQLLASAVCKKWHLGCKTMSLA